MDLEKLLSYNPVLLALVATLFTWFVTAMGASMVFFFKTINKKILKHAPRNAKLLDSAKMTLEEIINVMDTAHKKGIDVARLHSGDPSIYGAIQEQIEALDEKGIRYEIIPGVSSFQAAAASLNQELTLPGVSQTVILTRRAGKTPVPERQSLAMLAKSLNTSFSFSWGRSKYSKNFCVNFIRFVRPCFCLVI